MGQRTSEALMAAVLGAGRLCPVCDSGTGEQVRAGLFDGRFLTTLLATLLPFLVFAIIVALLHRGSPTIRSRTEEEPP